MTICVEEQPARKPVTDVLLGRTRGAPSRLGFQAPSVTPPNELIRFNDDSHLITFARTGAGKGRSVIVPNLLHYEGSVVAVDVKNGELTRITARRRAEMGQPVLVVDPCNVTNYPAASLNPFDLFSWPGSDMELDAEMLADVFSQGNKGVKDPFWDQHGTGLLAGVITHIASRPDAERHMGKVIDLLMADDVVYGLAVLLDTVGKSMPRSAYREIASFLQLPEVTRGGVLATTLSYLKTFHSAGVLRSLGPSTVSLEDLIAGRPMTIYLVLPVDRIQSHRAFLKLMLGVVLKAIVSRQGRPDTPTLLLIDECGQLGRFPFLETFITVCRSFGCRAWTFWQDLAQLQTSYPTSWKTILNNCGVIQAFGFHNRDLAEQWGGYFESSPAELKALKEDEQVVLIPGNCEIRAAKLDYLTDAMFAGQFDANPVYMARQNAPTHQRPADSRGEFHDSVKSPNHHRRKSTGEGHSAGPGGLQPL